MVAEFSVMSKLATFDISGGVSSSPDTTTSPSFMTIPAISAKFSSKSPMSVISKAYVPPGASPFTVSVIVVYVPVGVGSVVSP